MSSRSSKQLLVSVNYEQACCNMSAWTCHLWSMWKCWTFTGVISVAIWKPKFKPRESQKHINWWAAKLKTLTMWWHHSCHHIVHFYVRHTWQQLATVSYYRRAFPLVTIPRDIIGMWYSASRRRNYNNKNVNFLLFIAQNNLCKLWDKTRPNRHREVTTLSTHQQPDVGPDPPFMEWCSSWLVPWAKGEETLNEDDMVNRLQLLTMKTQKNA